MRYGAAAMARFPLREEPAGAEFLGASAPPDWPALFAARGVPAQASPAEPGPGALAPTRGPAPVRLELEIGCGAGGFALAYCARFPGVAYVAFEWRKKFAREVHHRARQRGLANLLVIEGDARLEVPRLFPPASLSAIRLQFPDPWWKRAHQKRAILQPAFAAFLLTRLGPGGLFDFRTDVEDLAHRALSVLEAAGFHNPLGPGAFHPFDPDEVPSTRERRYLVTGQPVYRARFLRSLAALDAQHPKLSDFDREPRDNGADTR